MRQVRGDLENLPCEMIDAAKEATTARNENAGAEITEIGLFFQPAFE